MSYLFINGKSIQHYYKDSEVEMEKDSHCKDCCCAKSWEALGIKEFTGLSIPEHIKERTMRELP